MEHILSKDETLRITLNIDGEPVASRSQTQPYTREGEVFAHHVLAGGVASSNLRTSFFCLSRQNINLPRTCCVKAYFFVSKRLYKVTRPYKN